MNLIREVWNEQSPEQWAMDVVGMIALAIVCGAFVVLGMAVVPQ